MVEVRSLKDLEDYAWEDGVHLYEGYSKDDLIALIDEHIKFNESKIITLREQARKKLAEGKNVLALDFRIKGRIQRIKALKQLAGLSTYDEGDPPNLKEECAAIKKRGIK